MPWENTNSEITSAAPEAVPSKRPRPRRNNRSRSKSSTPSSAAQAIVELSPSGEVQRVVSERAQAAPAAPVAGASEPASADQVRVSVAPACHFCGKRGKVIATVEFFGGTYEVPVCGRCTAKAAGRVALGLLEAFL